MAGRRPVEEAFAAHREARRLYVVPGRRAALEALVLHATTLRIPVIEIEGGSLTALTGFDGHQGVALVVGPRPWATLEDVIATALERGERPFVLALDSLEDPHNLGSLLRSAEAAGVHGVLFPTRRSAPLSPSAIKASAGAVEHLHLVPVSDLAGALADLHVRGLRIVGADQAATMTYREADLRGPLVIVVGSEGQGLGSAIRRRLDLVVRIPMRGRISSLNAAVAGSVLLLEAAGQRSVARPGSESTEAGSESPTPTPADLGSIESAPDDHADAARDDVARAEQVEAEADAGPEAEAGAGSASAAPTEEAPKPRRTRTRTTTTEAPEAAPTEESPKARRTRARTTTETRADGTTEPTTEPATEPTTPKARRTRARTTGSARTEPEGAASAASTDPNASGDGVAAADPEGDELLP